MASSKMSAGYRRTTTITARAPFGTRFVQPPTTHSGSPPPRTPRTLRTPTRRRRSDDDVPIRPPKSWTPSSSGPGLPGCTSSTNCASRACGCGRSTRRATWAAPGGGTATPGRASTARPTSTSTTSTRSSTRTGAGARSSPASPRSSVAALRHRPARPAQGHPVLHRDHQRPLRRGPRPLDDHHRPRRRHRRPVLRELRGHALRADGASVRGPGQLPRPDPAHLEWPAGGIDLAGKRVGVVGIGATGIQVIQTIADEVEPPHRLRPHPAVHAADEEPALRSRRSRRRTRPGSTSCKATIPHTFTGFEYDLGARLGRLHPRAAPRDPRGDLRGRLAQAVAGGLRRDVLLAGGQRGGLRVRPRARCATRLKDDPHLIDVLVPTDYGFGTHRVPLERNYLEVYRRDNVELVGVRDNPIARITPEGIELADGTVHELDVIIWPPASTPAPARSPASTSAAARAAASPRTGAATSAR